MTRYTKIAFSSYISLLSVILISCCLIITCNSPRYAHNDVHLITFGSRDFVLSAHMLKVNASMFGSFSSIRTYGIQDVDQDFMMRNAKIMASPRGHGYWLWKPYIILKRLLEIPENDILCYIDARYTITGDLANRIRARFANQGSSPFVCVLDDHHFVPGNRFSEAEWSKCDAGLIMDVPIHKDDSQAWAGFIALRKCRDAILFVSEWLTYVQDPRIVTDDPDTMLACTVDSNTQLIENRHDQTALSLLLRKWKISAESSDLSDIVKRN